MFTLIYVLIVIAVALLDNLMGWTFGGVNGDQNGVLTTLVTLGLFLPSLSLCVRRLHDLGHSGWWVLLGFVPIVNLLMLIYMAFDSQEGPNEYGPNPKGVGNTPTLPPQNSFIA